MTEFLEQARLFENIFTEILEILSSYYTINNTLQEKNVYIYIANFLLDMKLLKPAPVSRSFILDTMLQKKIIINCNFQRMPTIASYIIDMQLATKNTNVNTGYFNKLIESTQRMLDILERGFIYDPQKVMLWKLEDLQRCPFRPQIFKCIEIEQAIFNVPGFDLPVPRVPDQIHQVIFDARMHRGGLEQLFMRVPPVLMPEYQRILMEQWGFELQVFGHIFYIE